MKKVSKVIIGILWIVTIVLSFYVGMTYHWVSTTELDFSIIKLDLQNYDAERTFLWISRLKL